MLSATALPALKGLLKLLEPSVVLIRAELGCNRRQIARHIVSEGSSEPMIDFLRIETEAFKSRSEDYRQFRVAPSVGNSSRGFETGSMKKRGTRQGP